MIVSTMAKLNRKRKQPALLTKAELLVRSTNTANKTVMDLYQQLRSTVPQLIDGGQVDALSADSLATWLIANLRVEEVHKQYSRSTITIPSS